MYRLFKTDIEKLKYIKFLNITNQKKIHDALLNFYDNQ